jgi:hypothetical protein
VLHFRDVVLLGTPGSSHISPWTAPCCTQSRFSRLQAEHFGRVLSHLTLRERQVEHAFDRGLIAFLLICCKSHRKKKARPSHQIGKYARPRRPKACRFAHTGELLLGVKVWCFGGKHTQRQIGSRKPTVRVMIGEHRKLVTEQTWAELGCATFYSVSTAFSVEFAQEVKAGVGFSHRRLRRNRRVRNLPVLLVGERLLSDGWAVVSSFLGQHLLFLGNHVGRDRDI